MLACLMLASAIAAPVITREIRADAAPLAHATGGLVRDVRPVLGYDLQALAKYEPGARQPAIKLGYAGFDDPGRDWPELKTAHQTAADIVREPPQTPDSR